MSDPEVRDVAVIGGGIVGLATAWRLLQRDPNLSLTVLEKEDGLARHQSGRNSGVLHSGIYYEPRSAKARLCRRGKEEMEAFCRDHAIPVERCGKVIVGVEKAELSRLDELLERGRANGVDCRKIGPDRLAEIEPHVRGLAAIPVPEAGIVDYREVCLELARQVQTYSGRSGGESTVAPRRRANSSKSHRYQLPASTAAEGRARASSQSSASGATR